MTSDQFLRAWRENQEAGFFRYHFDESDEAYLERWAKRVRALDAAALLALEHGGSMGLPIADELRGLGADIRRRVTT